MNKRILSKINHSASMTALVNNAFRDASRRAEMTIEDAIISYQQGHNVGDLLDEMIKAQKQIELETIGTVTRTIASTL